MARVRSRGKLCEFFRRIEQQRDAAARPTESVDQVSVSIPAGIDWDIHRIASSERYSDSYVTICHEWSLDDLYEAHTVLDMYDELAKKEAAAQRAAAEGDA